LFGLLYSQINPQILVADLMSRPAVVIEESKTIVQASEIMTRFGLKAIPVIKEDGQECVGILEHQLADKAIGHGLGKIPIREYMITDIATLEPSEDIYRVMEIIIGQRQRLIPIVENGKVIAVVTRTDLINNLIKEPARIPESLLPEKKRERNIKRILQERLPEHIFSLLQAAGYQAREMGFQVYCVGGFVRDILLDRNNLDVDLVVEGDGIEFARALAQKLNARVREHQKFRTAVIIREDGQKIDVATARLEYYEHPAALPTVELSSIKMDLYRRDFSINALAVHLNPEHFGKVVDFFGGQRDLKEKVIRVLHSLSFVEDPTRIIRAIRFEQRFGFRIGAQTEKLIKNAMELNIFHQLSGSRIFHELKLIFDEDNPLPCISRMDNFGLLRNVHTLLKLAPKVKNILVETEKVINWFQLLYLEEELEKWTLYLLGLLSSINDTQAKIILNRFNFSKKRSTFFFSLRSQIRYALNDLYTWNKKQDKLSSLYFILQPLPLEGQLFLMAKVQQEDLRKFISYYITQLRGIQLKMIFEEDNPLPCITRMDNYGLLRNIHTLLKLSPKVKNILMETEKVINWFQLLYLEEELEKWTLYLLGLLSSINDTQAKIILNRFNFSKKRSTFFFSLRSQIHYALIDLYAWNKKQDKLSSLYFILQPLPLEGQLFLMAKVQQEDLRKFISYYITQLRGIQPQLTGKDLKRLGLEPGPEFGRILQELKAAQIDGLSCDRQSQIDWVKKKYLHKNRVGQA